MNDYDPRNIKKVRIEDILPNDWNPKGDEKAYRKVVRSIGLNGLMTPIFVRSTPEGYEVVDGFHRWMACKELGYSEIYIYDLGDIEEADAKALALWFQVQVPFDDILLAPLVLDLEKVGMELPYSEKEMDGFRELEQFDMGSAWEDEEPVPEEEKEEKEKLKSFTVKLESEEVSLVMEAVNIVKESENVNEGKALELLISAGVEIIDGEK